MSRRHVSFWLTCIQGALVITITGLGSHWLNAHTAFKMVPSIFLAFAVGMVTGYAVLGVANGLFHTYTEDGNAKSRSPISIVIIAAATMAIAALDFIMP